MLLYIYALLVLAAVLFGYILGPDVTHISLLYFDSVLHFLAGVGFGFLLVGLASSFPRFNARRFSKILVAMFIVGFVWEIYEAYFNISGYPLWTKVYYIDTVKDLILDVIGAALVARFYIKKDVQ